MKMLKKGAVSLMTFGFLAAIPVANANLSTAQLKFNSLVEKGIFTEMSSDKFLPSNSNTFSFGQQMRPTPTTTTTSTITRPGFGTNVLNNPLGNPLSQQRLTSSLPSTGDVGRLNFNTSQIHNQLANASLGRNFGQFESNNTISQSPNSRYLGPERTTGTNANLATITQSKALALGATNVVIGAVVTIAAVTYVVTKDDDGNTTATGVR